MFFELIVSVSLVIIGFSIFFIARSLKKTL
jgi:hypothetical protein